MFYSCVYSYTHHWYIPVNVFVIKQTTFFKNTSEQLLLGKLTYLFPGVDPGLILGCCKILQEKMNIKMMQYAEKL